MSGLFHIISLCQQMQGDERVKRKEFFLKGWGEPVPRGV